MARRGKTRPPLIHPLKKEGGGDIPPLPNFTGSSRKQQGGPVTRGTGAREQDPKVDGGRQEDPMPLRPCLVCGQLTRESRCPTHARGERTWTERQRRAATVTAWRQANGDWCPGWLCAPHPASDLTADHTTPWAVAGTEDGPLAVLCVSCNSRKKDNTD